MSREHEKEVTLRCVEVIEKEVLNAKTTGRIYLPKAWIGRTVAVALLPKNGE